MNRICYNCKKIKPLKDFKKNSGKPLGYDYQCKICHNIEHKKWNRKNPVKTLVKAAKQRARKENK